MQTKVGGHGASPQGGTGDVVSEQRESPTPESENAQPHYAFRDAQGTRTLSKLQQTHPLIEEIGKPTSVRLYFIC